jgi:hypothetical protein
MSRFCTAFAAVGFLLAGLVGSEAGVVVTVNKSTQRLTVEIDGVVRHEWPVSTARWGYNTPNGTYRPQWLAREWFSRKYDWSPMPYSIFFHHGYAIHGSYEIRNLGRPASHGCIRLQPKNAAVLFNLVQANRGTTRIVVTGERPSRSAVARRTREETSTRQRPQRETASARRQRERAAERRIRERVTTRRTRKRQPNFEEVFVPPPSYAYREEFYPTARDLERSPRQRALRRQWYSR